MRAAEREFEVREEVGPVPIGSILIFDDSDGSIHLLVRLFAHEAARIMTEGDAAPFTSRPASLPTACGDVPSGPAPSRGPLRIVR